MEGQRGGDVCEAGMLSDVTEAEIKAQAKEIYEKAIEYEDWESLFDGRTVDEKEEEETHEDEPDGPEEGIAATGVTLPEAPTQTEIEEHCRTHIPFRSWCYHCVCGNALNDSHNDVSE